MNIISEFITRERLKSVERKLKRRRYELKKARKKMDAIEKAGTSETSAKAAYAKLDAKRNAITHEISLLAAREDALKEEREALASAS